MVDTGTCPICSGSKEVNGRQCSNCGGQTMGGFATGVVNLNKQGVPCTHSYAIATVGSCYHRYSCTECSFVFMIDSGD